MSHHSRQAGLRLAGMLLVLFLFVAGARSGQAGQTATGSRSGIAQDGAATRARVIESTRNGMVLEVTLPPVALANASSDRGACTVVKVLDWAQAGNPGEPLVPVIGALIGIPVGATPRLVQVETGPRATQAGIDLCPQAIPILSADLLHPMRDMGEQRVVNAEAYAADTEYPGPLAQLGAVSVIRSRQTARVLLQPVRYNPVARELSTYAWLRVRIAFDGGTRAPNGAAVRANDGPVDQVLRDVIVNDAQSRQWQLPPTAVPATPAAAATPRYKVAVNQDGIVHLTYAALQTAGVPVGTIDPRTFRLLNQNSEIALQLRAATAGVFGPGDDIIFYGQKSNTQYTDANAYWLTWGGADGQRMAVFDGTPSGASAPAVFTTTQHAELNKLYLPNHYTGTDHDHWYWDYIQATTPATKSFTLTLSHVSTATLSARVRGVLKGYSAVPRQHTRIYINDHLIADDYWPSQAEYAFDAAVPQSYLVEGTNTIKVNCPMTDGITLNIALINWLEVDYAKTYAADGAQTRFAGDSGTWSYSLPGFASNDILTWDITNPTQPVVVSNTLVQPVSSTYALAFQHSITSVHQYVAVSDALLPGATSITPANAVDLLAATNAADYIVISHQDFITAIQPLIAFHAAEGLRMKVVDVQDVYDTFSGGVFDPQAIHDFLAYAYATWTPPAPSYVLLVGDGNYDFKNNLRSGEVNYIPPYLAEVDPWFGQTAADNRYVAFNGSNALPDMALGRLPVKTAAETANIVTKILSYAQNYTGVWAKRALLVAGVNDPAAGDFPAVSDAVANTYLIPGGMTVDTMYYGVTHNSTSSARQAIVDAINAGRGIVQYTGHSSPNSWYGDPGNPSGTFLEDKNGIAALNNTVDFPFLLSMTCYTGYYVSPPQSGSDQSSLDELWLRAPGKGAVGSWSPTGKGLVAGHDVLDQGFMNAVYAHKQNDIGKATLEAKYYLFANSVSYNDLIDTFVLFGDPALRLNIATQVFLPAVLR